MNPEIRDLLLFGRRRYVGPGDIALPWPAWYGLCAYSAAAAASGVQKAINIRASGDNATTDILILPSGYLDIVSAMIFQAVHGGNLFITKIYDQSGNTGRDASQGTAANQPQLVFNALGALPGIFFVRASSTGLIATIPIVSQPNTWSFVSKRSGSLTSPQLIIGSGATTDNNEAYYDAVVNTITGYAGTNQTVTALDNAFHSSLVIMNGASGIINVDGVASTKNMGTQPTNTLLTIGSRSGAFLDGYILQCGLLASAPNASKQLELIANDRSKYGTP